MSQSNHSASGAIGVVRTHLSETVVHSSTDVIEVMLKDLELEPVAWPPDVYLAGRLERREEIAAYRDQLAAAGITVTSSWLDAPTSLLDYHCTPAELRAIAIQDLDDINGADLILMFTEPADSAHPRGGRHVEFGYAFGLLPMWLIGPRENVFHYLVPDSWVFPDFNSALERLADADRWTDYMGGVTR